MVKYSKEVINEKIIFIIILIFQSIINNIKDKKIDKNHFKLL